MEFVVYCFQVRPGCDDLLWFAETEEACRQAALSQREELLKDEDCSEFVGAMAIYRCRMKQPEVSTMIKLLNSPDDPTALFKECVVDRRLVAVVAE